MEKSPVSLPPTSTPPSGTRSPKSSQRAELERVLSNVRFLRAHGHLRMKSPPAKPQDE